MSKTVTGILQINQEKANILLDPKKSFRPEGWSDPIIPNQLVSKYKLIHGAMIKGVLQENNNKTVVESITSICDLPPEDYMKRTPYKVDLPETQPISHL